MTLSHIATILLKPSILQQIFLFIGAIAMPIFCFLLAEGFLYTKNKKKYFLRLLVFGIISNLAFSYSYGTSLLFSGAITTLMIGFVILWVWTSKLHLSVKFWIIVILLGISFYGDWGTCAPLWIMVFYRFRDNPKTKFLLFLLIGFSYNLFLFAFFSIPVNLGFILAVFVLSRYYPIQKEKRINKWISYWYYPLHLVILKWVSLFLTV